MTKLSHIIDTDAVYQEAVRQLRHNATADQWSGRLTDELITAKLRALGDPFATPAAFAPPTGPR